MTTTAVTTAPSPIRLAIVGSGQISHRYLGQEAPGVEFVATCARRSESAEALANRYGIPSWFDDSAAMYDAVRPDGVVIATPSNAHRAPAVAALDRGIGVLCEKPMATSLADCEAMVAAAERSGAAFVSLPYDDGPVLRAALDLLDEPTLGVFTGAEAQLMIDGHPRANWYYDREAAGGVMLDTLVYPVSRLIALLGPAARVTAFANTLLPRRIVGDEVVETEIDDNVTLVLEWANGQQATVRALWGTAHLVSTNIVYGRHGTLWFEGPDLIVYSTRRDVEGAETLTHRGVPGCRRIPVAPQPERLVSHFADCIRTGAPSTSGGRQQLHVHEILFAAYESARSGRAQELRTTFEPWHPRDPAFFDTRSRPL